MGAPPQLPPKPPRARLLVLGLSLTLVLLLFHACHYAFLTDDAFISYRYARNLSEGHGLVFNPGLERVEGYTNFLWVLILATFQLLGLAPETVSHGLTLLFTVVLWGLVVGYGLGEAPEENHRWLVLIPPLFLAVTRSFAVWSTSGLETRLFELLVFAAVLRLIVEVHRAPDDDGHRSWWSGLLFGLATLTRPDGLLISLSAYGAAFAKLRCSGRRALPTLLFPLTALASMTCAHTLFRWIYYGDLLPNTYYAKVGGRLWWSMGLKYLAMFFAEYGIYLWIPLLAAAVAYHSRRGTWLVPAVFGAVIVPHAIYVASIGGDHFEYRPLDLYFPFLFLLLFQGAKHLASRGIGWHLSTAAYLALVLVFLVALPFESHRQYPDDAYRHGFPGLWVETSKPAADYMSPNGPYRLPGLRSIAEAHRSWLRKTSSAFVGLRAEEHRDFLATVIPEGQALRELVEEGILPSSTYIAIDSVGAIPYYAALPTLDRLGLTDHEVARSEAARQQFLAHDKRATLAYGRKRNVDFWALHFVHLTFRRTDPEFLALLTEAHSQESPSYFAELDGARYLLALLPRGLENARSRFPRLELFSVSDDDAVRRVLEKAVDDLGRALGELPHQLDLRSSRAGALTELGRFDDAAREYEQILEIDPEHKDTVAALGLLLVRQGQTDDAAEHYEHLLRTNPDDATALSNLGNIRMLQGRTAAAIECYTTALERGPETPAIHMNLANAFASEGELSKVVHHYREALRIEPHHPDAHYFLGNIMAAQGRTGLAMAHYVDALRSNPDMGEARERLEALRAGQRTEH